MSRCFRTKEFKTLLAQWNEKLIQSGHKEIETFKYGEPKLKSYSSEIYKVQSQGKKDYYEMADEVLETYWFERPQDFTIWYLHTEGKPVRKIASQITPAYSKSAVFKIIQSIQKKSGLKNG